MNTNEHESSDAPDIFKPWTVPARSSRASTRHRWFSRGAGAGHAPRPGNDRGPPPHGQGRQRPCLPLKDCQPV